jgi:3,4-dihydroxy 2-butanone 4-phosphate synthase/GTP cyclohydrolase II
MLDADGALAPPDVVQALAETKQMPVVAVPEVARYRSRHEDIVEVAVRIQLPTPHGDFEAIALTSPIDTAPYLALVAAGMSPASVPLVSLHRSCLGAAVRSRECTCRARLDRAMEMIGRDGGVIVHLPRAEPHDVLGNAGANPAIDDAGIAGLVLRALGVRRARLIEGIELGLERVDGLEIVDVVRPG